MPRTAANLSRRALLLEELKPILGEISVTGVADGTGPTGPYGSDNQADRRSDLEGEGYNCDGGEDITTIEADDGYGLD